jgi:hypothetical protein
MRSANSMLLDATRKLLELHDDPQWAIQLPQRCPPVLWFGNATSSKPKVLTIGANPSRQEFLLDSSVQALEKVLRLSGDQSLLSYREPPGNRFRLLCGRETLADILTSEKLQKQVIDRYNKYFTGNPYTIWFGHDCDDSYKVEGFLRGFGASYYDGNTVPQQAIHIDLFPFATLDDFGRIKAMAKAAFFADGWARCLLSRLVEYLSPAALVLFGRTNCEYFGRYVDRSVSCISWQSFGAGKYLIGRSERFGVPVVGLSTNLGNPRGFDASELREYGKRLGQLIHETTRTT